MVHMQQCNMFRNKKLEPGYGGDIMSFTVGLMAVIVGIRLAMEGGNWLFGIPICLLVAVPCILYGISYRLVDKKEDSQ